MENLFYLKGKTTGQTSNKSIIIKSITIVLLKFMPNLRSSPNIIIFSLTLNKFSKGNPKYFCVCFTAKEKFPSFSLLSHTHPTTLLVVVAAPPHAILSLNCVSPFSLRLAAHHCFIYIAMLPPEENSYF